MGVGVSVGKADGTGVEPVVDVSPGEGVVGISSGVADGETDVGPGASVPAGVWLAT